MMLARVPHVMVLMVLAGSVGGCSDNEAGRCASDDDCTRRELCSDGVCVPLVGDVADAGDANEVDAGDVADDTSEEVDVAEVETDRCGDRCATDELCSVLGECICTPGLVRQCTSKGECSAGNRSCVDGAWSECLALPVDALEVCDGRDNNCNGLVDEGVCSPPVVTCPPPQVVDVSAPAALEGAGNDPDGGDLTFEWTVRDSPAQGSNVGPVPFDSASSVLVPDEQGTWQLSLCAVDDEGVQACCETSVTARAPCVAPATPAIEACGTSWDRRPIVQFAPLPAGHVYAISVDGQALGEVTLAKQNYFRPSEPIGIGGAPPLGTSATLGLRECMADDSTCCSAEATAVVGLVASCDTPIAPSNDNLVISEYLINGDGNPGCPGASCEAGEAIELTNLSNCPVALAGHHLRYCNNVDCTSARRYDNFDAAEVIPPRGVFVRIRNPAASTCGFDFLPALDSDAVFGIRRSTLELEVDGPFNNSSGWFNNGAAGSLRVATGVYEGPFSGTTVLLVTGYVANQSDCESVGFDAVGACGELAPGVVPSDKLRDNQLGRLWHPCDSVVAAYPPGCFE